MSNGLLQTGKQLPICHISDRCSCLLTSYLYFQKKCILNAKSRMVLIKLASLLGNKKIGELHGSVWPQHVTSLSFTFFRKFLSLYTNRFLNNHTIFNFTKVLSQFCVVSFPSFLLYVSTEESEATSSQQKSLAHLMKLYFPNCNQRLLVRLLINTR